MSDQIDRADGDSRAVRPGGVTADDVAAALGLSTTTVWRALRDSPLVREQTRQRIVETARDMGFESNWIARSLSTRSSLFIGMVVPDMTQPVCVAMIEGAQDALEQHGYQLLLMNIKRQVERHAGAVRMLRAHRVAGLLLAGAGEFEPSDLPTVCFDTASQSGAYSAVLPANREGIELLVRHLLEHGHTRIAYLGGPRSIGAERCAAFEDTLRRAWLGVPTDYIRMDDTRLWDAASAEPATAALLALETPPTAIVAGSDTLAVGAIRALYAAGKRIPEDVALVSFNDPPLGDVLDPPLTALSLPAREMGAQAVELLLEQLDRRQPPREVRIPVELVVRRSCGCP